MMKLDKIRLILFKVGYNQQKSLAMEAIVRLYLGNNESLNVAVEL